MHQFSIYDYAKPNDNGTKDEILRLHAEVELERKIKLTPCCGEKPKVMFRDVKERWVRCPICGKQTKVYKKDYLVMQAWNRGDYV